MLNRPVSVSERITWEAVLHPSTSALREPEPLDGPTMAKWFRLVSRLDGESHEAYVRQVGGLTFAPVVLDSSRVDELARFNPLRALRPMPALRPRPLVGTRAVARLGPPPCPSTVCEYSLLPMFQTIWTATGCSTG